MKKVLTTRAQTTQRGAILEKKLAELENGRSAIAFSSGMAAITALMHTLKAGDHIIFAEDIYGGTYRLLKKVLEKFGLQSSFIDPLKLFEENYIISENTKMIFLETPTNPMLKIYNIKEIAKIAHEHELLLAVDNTFMTPYFQQPLELGADIVVHSLTKYLSGHDDVVGGTIIANKKSLLEQLEFINMSTGPNLGPFDAWLTIRGIKTLAVRMERHNKNAQEIAKFLAGEKKVKQVIYPGLKTHPQYKLAKKQMSGFGGIITLELKNFEEVKNFIAKLKIWKLAESFGGTHSLVVHPATMTHASIPKEEREKRGITDNLIRLSVGIEDSEDLIKDLELALKST